jgi:5-methylthioadenosine/S-adenosylhomocysteine deaminase
MGYIMPTEREFVTPEFVRLGTALGCAELIASGVTTAADMYYFEDEVAEVAAEIGLRVVCGQTILKFPAPDAISYEESLDYCRTFIQKWRDHPLIIPSVAPHAPYTSNPDILHSCVALAVEFDVPLQIHLSETAPEVEESRRQHGMPVIPWVKKQDLFDAKVIAAHCVHVDDGEIYTLEHHGVGVAHNPTSNLKLASGIAPVTRMLEIGVNVGIGTDGPSSNNDLDMFEEMRLAALIAKVATDDPTALPARQALTMATRLGARSLHIEHLTGSLEPGKRADIIVVDMHAPHNWPQFSHDPDAPYSRLVYAAKSTDVAHVLCNGSWLMRDRQFLTVDMGPVLSQAADVAAQIDSFIIAREENVLSKLVAIGGVSQEESFEVQVKARLEDPDRVHNLLTHPDVTIIKHTHYRQYDTYFEFSDASQGRVRYREDDAIDEDGEVVGVRTRLTLTGPSREHEFDNAILLSRSRFIAPADRPLRFYREYFRPAAEREIAKERRRWHVDFRGLRFYVNVDEMIEPRLSGCYVEVKSRTWSKADAGRKAALIVELLEIMGIQPSDLLAREYIDIHSEET